MFGELGILEDNGEKVRCHVCGKWFKALKHSHLLKHNLDASAYRAKFGLNIRQPLASTESRSKSRDCCTPFIAIYSGKPSEKFLARDRKVPCPRRKQWLLNQVLNEVHSKRGKARALKLTKEQMSEIGRKGGNARAAKLSYEQMSKIGKKGGLSSSAKRTPEQRIESAKRAAFARWGKK